MAAKKKKRKKGGNDRRRGAPRPPARLPEVAAYKAPWRPTERQLQAAAAVAIDPACSGSQIKIAAAIGITQQSVSVWFKDPEFRAWWNDHLIRIHQDGQGSALSILREIFEDPATEPRDRIVAIREYLSALENRKPRAGSELVALLRELRGAPPGSRLAMQAEDADGTRLELLAQSPAVEQLQTPRQAREAARRESDTFLEAGEMLGAVQASPNRSTERAAQHAIEAIAKRAADETCGDSD